MSDRHSNAKEPHGGSERAFGSKLRNFRPANRREWQVIGDLFVTYVSSR